MSSSTVLQVPDFRRFVGNSSRHSSRLHPFFASPTIKNVYTSSLPPWKKDDDSWEIQMPLVHQLNIPKPSDLNFNRSPPSNRERDYRLKRVFGHFVARDAILDEEYWAAAWLRAESHWEDRSDERYVDSYKRKFAKQEFNALKRRCCREHAEKCTCIVVVKEERVAEHTVLNSVVGTLDISIPCLSHGENFPREHVEPSTFSSISTTEPRRYGYIENLCVAEFARQQGIASNMLYLAIETAKTSVHASGAERIYVHVHKDNKPARQLYEKIGFQMVEIETPNTRFASRLNTLPMLYKLNLC